MHTCCCRILSSSSLSLSIGKKLHVQGLDCIGIISVVVIATASGCSHCADREDGTPVLDLKPVMAEFLPRGEVAGHFPCQAPMDH